MSHKHFGVTITIVGLLAASSIALGEVEEGSYARTEISGQRGWGHFDAPIRALVVDSSEVADVDAAGRRDTSTRSPRYENNPGSELDVNIPTTTRSSVLDDSPAEDPYLQSGFGKGNSDNIGTLPSGGARRLSPGSSRAVTLVSHAKPTLPAAGCARCFGQVAAASAGGTKLFKALFSSNFFRKGSPVEPRHLVSGNVRLRNPPLLTVSTIKRSWLNPSL